MNTQVSYFKKALVVLMAVMMVFTMMPSMAWADDTTLATSGTCGADGNAESVNWSFASDDGVLTISGSGDMADYTTASPAPWQEHKDSVTKVKVEDGVTSIGSYAFRAYTNLQEVTLPSSVIKIGDSAFDGATKLTGISLNSIKTIGAEAFVDCTGINSISLDSAQTIGQVAFANCSGLTSVTLGSAENQVELVGKQAFGKCAALKSVAFTNVKELGEESFTMSGLTSVDLTGVEAVGKKAFSRDTNLASVTFGSTAIQIGNQAFSNSGLVKVSVPGTASLDNYAFYNCKQLTEAILGEGITTIPSSCFNGAAALKSVTIPATITTIAKNAFAKCTTLETAHYAGTKEQWNAVSVDTGNEALTALMNKDAVAVTGVSLNKTELELKLNGEAETLVAAITPSDATNTGLTWASDDEEVATVDSQGTVTPVGIGTTNITVTTKDGGFQANCKVHVASSGDDSDQIDLTKFTFTVDNPGENDPIFEENTLRAEKQTDGSYTLAAPTYTIEYGRNPQILTIKAPDDFDTPFSVTYTYWKDSSENSAEKRTVQSENGVLTLTNYYCKFGKRVSGLVDNAYGLLYSDFLLKVEGSDNAIPISFDLHNELRYMSITNQTNSASISRIKRVDATTFETQVTRGETYSIYAAGGFSSNLFAHALCTISDGTNSQQDVGHVSLNYTPGEETSKDFTIHITDRESSYGISEGVYTLRVIVNAPLENPPVFEKYIYTVNGQEYEPKYDSALNRYEIPKLTQFDKLTIKAVVKNAGEDAIYHWTQWNDERSDSDALIEVDTTSSNSSSYQFNCSMTLSNGYEIKLPELYVVSLDIKSIPAPAMITQPTSGTYPIGMQVKLSALVAYPETGSPKFQWYRCDDASGTNAEAIEDATDSTRRLDGYISTYIAPSSEIGTKWYYCEYYSYYGDLNSVKVKTDCVKVEIVKNALPMEGDGTQGNPYKITKAEDLVAIQTAVAEGNAFTKQYFEFANDVTLPENWKPIGCTKDGSDKINAGENLYPFSGNINGAGYTLTVPEGGLPLLGYVVGASVKNLNIYGTKIAGYGLVNDFHGVGLSGSGIVIDNVTLKKGTQTLKSGLIGTELNSENAFAGASAAFQATIRNCTVEEGVIIGYGKDQSMIGSIAGRLHCVIENCKSDATVYGVDYVGGILGCRDNAMGTCSVSSSSFGGSVIASGTHAGGIVGGGYTNQSAPNGIKVTVNNNKVTGSVTGKDKVGGILGGDSFVAQAWNSYNFKVNRFTGSVKATDGNAVGAIIGYYRSLNKMDNIVGNTYSGAEKGIGFVQYLDTSYANASGMDDTIIFNTAKGTKDLPKVDGCAWKANHNRTDDPLGADKDNLAKKTDEEPQEVFCYELELKEGTIKTEYYIGEEFNLDGVTFTAKMTDGTTKEVSGKEITVSDYNKNSHSIQTVTLTYGYGQLTVQVAVKQKESGDVTKDTLTVSFTLLGDSKHEEAEQNGGPHGLAMGGLTTWMSGSYEVKINSTVWDLMQQIQNASNGKVKFLARDSQYGTYVEGVTFDGTTLSEFDNGNLSGWMYTLNGKHPEVGVAAQFLSNRDTVVFHYTDDYTKEEGSEKWNAPGGGVVEEVKDVTTDTKTGTTTAPTDVKVSEKTNADGTKTKVAEVKVSADNQKEVLKQAKASKSNEIILVVSSKSVGDATKADVTLDKSFIDSIVKDTNAKLTIKTPFGDKTYTQEELKAMSEAATGSTITVAIEKAAEEPTDDAAAKMEKAKSIVKDLKLVARSSKTAKKNIKAVLKNDAKTKASVQELKDLGFTVKYRFYRSTKKASSYKSTVTKKTATYTNTSGKKGTKYFYKVQVRVYDENGKLIAKTALKQCKYATRTWSKAK